MKLVKILLLINLLSITAYGQSLDSIKIEKDTIKFTTSNAFVIHQNNYETFNNSFITGNSYAVIRSQDNPRIFVDGIPMNPMIYNNTRYADFLGSMNLLAYDIETVTLKTLANENRINAGQNNNSLDFQTFDVKPGKAASRFEVNNFTAFTYKDIETRGYSTITNVNMRQGFKKIGYRISLSNGFNNDYLPENGVQRYSGNLKLNYQPIKAISLAGFIDYSSFQDFKREADHLNETMDSSEPTGFPFSNGSGKNTLKSSRLFAYIKGDITLTKGLSVYGKWAHNNLADKSERYIFFNNFNEPSSIGSFESNDFKDQSTYTDFGFKFVQSIRKKALLNFNMGYSQNDHQYDRKYENYFLQSGNLSRCHSNPTPETKEKVFYTSLKMSNKYLIIQYLFNRNNYRDDGIFLGIDENMTFDNHLLSSNLDLIKNDTKVVNQLGVQLNLGKLINYSILLPPDYTKYANDNMEFVLYSSILKNRVDLNLSFYQKAYGNYAHLYLLNSPYGGIDRFLEDLGKVTKGGYELNGSALLVKSKTMDWLLAFSYSGNFAELSDSKHFGFVLADTVLNNTLISAANSIRYKGFQLGVELEHKEGYDVNLFQNNLSVAEPLPYWKREQITGVDNEGIPTIERINNFGDYITSTDYFILKHIGLEYKIRNKSKSVDYVIGIQYDKMRRLYLYVNDAEANYYQFQKPSFYNSLSLSFNMKF